LKLFNLSHTNIKSSDQPTIPDIEFQALERLGTEFGAGGDINKKASENNTNNNNSNVLALVQEMFGKSYKWQCTYHPEKVKIDCIADQLVWGVFRKLGCWQGPVARFL